MDIKKLAVIVAGSALLVGIFVALRERAGGDTVTAEVRTIEVSVRDGAVVDGARRFDVPRSGRVSIVVRTDARDRVHVHGYDLFAAVRPGAAARVDFRASSAGSFDVELEERRLLLLTLDVRP